jgi:predicted RNase H-like nuclease (RuvC/YqgF family)
MKEIIQENVALILTTIFGGGSFYGWLFERKKRKDEGRIVQADALSKMQEVYDKMVVDVDSQISRSKSNYEELQGKIEYSQNKIEQLENKLKEVEAYWKDKYNQLKKEFDNYKKLVEKKN